MAQTQEPIKRSVLDYDDIRKMVPFFEGKPRLVKFLLWLLSIDKVNDIHSRNCDEQGVAFSTALLKDLNIKVIVDNEEVLERLGTESYVTVSNHAYGALDGIALIDLVGRHNPKYKVMVNMILNYISAMRENFIAVDALASDDPKKRAVSVKGIMDAIRHVAKGNPIGFFPAGAVSKWDNHFELIDREWQPNVIQLIQRFKKPVVPIFFHGGNSWWFNLLGRISWQLRTLRLPAEVFRKKNSTMHITIGEPIPYEEIAKYDKVEDLAQFLKDKTYELKRQKH